MHPAFPRRDLWKLAPLGLAMPQGLAAATQPAPATDTFPVQQAAVVREMVAVSHGNLKRVRELAGTRFDPKIVDALEAAVKAGKLKLSATLVEV